jgi:hypothetical protein
VEVAMVERKRTDDMIGVDRKVDFENWGVKGSAEDPTV